MQLANGAIDAQPLYTGSPANCACTFAGIVIVTPSAAVVVLVFTTVKTCDSLGPRNVVGGLTVSSGEESEPRLKIGLDREYSNLIRGRHLNHHTL